MKIDLLDDYLSIPVRKDSQPYLAFIFDQVTYAFKTMLFRLNVAPARFTEVFKPALADLRAQSIRALIWLDDILVISSSYSSCIRDRDIVMDLLVNLGFQLNMEKSVLIPTERVIYLGMVIDSLTMTFSLPEEKVSAIVQKATLLKNKNQVSVREIYQFIGMCSATRLAVKEAPIHYRQLQHQVITLLKENLLLRNQCYSVKVILLPLALQDLDWWIHNLSTSISNPIILPPPDISIQTDASDLGWGGCLKPLRISGMWTRSQLFWHINRKELMAIFLSLKFFLKSQENVHVQIMTDNSTSVSYLNHMGGTKFSHSFKSGIRHLEMVPTKSYPHFSSTCCRSSEHLCRSTLPLSTVEQSGCYAREFSNRSWQFTDVLR